MVMVVEGGGGWEGWVMVFCAHLFMGDGMRGARTKITPFKIITEGGGGLEKTQRKI